MKTKHYYFYSIFITYILFIISLILYFNFFYKYISIPECPIYKYFGFYCPACGCTRSIIALINFNFVQSFLYNPIILYSFFISSLFLIVESINIFLKKNINLPWKLFIYIGLAILAINCLLQNTILHIL